MEIIERLRLRREGAVRRHFSRAAGDVEEIGRRLVGLRRALDAHTRSLEQLLSGGADAMNVRLYRQCIDGISQTIAEQQGRLVEARRRMQQRREQLLATIGRREETAAK